MKKLSFVLFTFLATFFVASAQDGSLDTGFGTGGTIQTQFSITSAVPNALTIQADGKIVVVGAANGALAISRYEQNGTADAFFGLGGYITHNVPGGAATVNAVKVQADGKILMGGTLGTQAFIARLTSAGFMDTGFGAMGIAIFGGTGSISEVMGFDITSNGRIVGGGRGTDAAMAPKFCAFRLMSSGATDANFGTGGVAQISPGGATATASAHGFVQQPDGKLLVCGEVYSGSSTDNDVIITRFNANGTVDNSFGTNGKAINSFGGNAKELARAIAVQSDGRIVIVGRRSSGGNKILVARYLANGTLDTSFGTSGSTTTSVSGYNNLDGRSIAFLSNGKFLICSEGAGASPAFIVARYNANGTLDNSYGSNGIAAHAVINRADARALAIQTNGKVVVCGSGLSSSNLFVFAVSRLNGSGTSGLFDAEGVAEAAIFPNPAQSEINIEWTDAMHNAQRIQAYDLSQRMIIDHAVQGVVAKQNYVLPVGNLTEGVYMLRILDAKGRTLAVQRFVKG